MSGANEQYVKKNSKLMLIKLNLFKGLVLIFAVIPTFWMVADGRNFSRFLTVGNFMYRRIHQISQQLKYSVEVHSKKNQSLRQFILDRPKAFNALNLEMIRTITPQLQAYQDSDLCKVIVLTSDHNKAFCAGKYWKCVF